MLKIILCGCSGKMGQSLERLISKQEDLEIVAGVSRNAPEGCKYPVFRDIRNCNIGANIIINFSRPETVESIAEYAAKNNIAVVEGTSGLSSSQLGMLRDLSQKVPVLQAANTALGFHLLVDLVKQAAIVLSQDFDIEIIEKHHNAKVDAPSGAALIIADAIDTVVDVPPERVYDRHSVRAARKKRELGIHSIRGGNIIGEHTVLFAGENELVEIKHTAQSKDIFASGALQAAKFVAAQKPGMYTMKDVITSNR